MLEDAENSTQLILNERLPASFDNVARDFAAGSSKQKVSRVLLKAEKLWRLIKTRSLPYRKILKNS